MPGLLDHLSNQVLAFKDGEPDPFNDAIKAQAGPGVYRVTHSDGTSQMDEWAHDVLGDLVARNVVARHLGSIHDIPNLQLDNICCNGCKISAGPLADDLAYRIQMAAVNTNPDGTPAS